MLYGTCFHSSLALAFLIHCDLTFINERTRSLECLRMLLHLVAYQVLIKKKTKQKNKNKNILFRVTQWVWTCCSKFVVHPDDAYNLNFPVSLSPRFYFIVSKWLEYRGSFHNHSVLLECLSAMLSASFKQKGKHTLSLQTILTKQSKEKPSSRTSIAKE